MTKIQRPGSPPPPPAPRGSTNRNKKKVVVHRGGGSPNRPKNKLSSSTPTDDSPDTGHDESSGFYDPNLVGPGNGNLFDPNNPYGRMPTTPNFPNFQDWAAQQGYNIHQLKKKGKQNQLNQIQDEYNRAAGPATQDYADTGEGQHYFDDHRDEYVNLAMARAGGLTGAAPIVGGATQFGQFLANDYRDQLEAGYLAARGQSGNNLTFTDYMATLGWGPGQTNDFNMPLQPAGASQPFHAQDTGNPYTSTSLPASTQAVTPNGPDFPGTPQSFRDYRQDQGIGQHQWQNMRNGRQNRIHNAFMGNQPTNAGTVVPDPTAAAALPNNPLAANTGLDDARRRFLALTPQQRGINSATSFRPGRWSVF